MRVIAACLAAVASLALPGAALATHAEPLRAEYHLDVLNVNPFGDTGPFTTTPDSSGHDLTLSGKPSGEALIDNGKFGKALRFNGSAGSDDDGMQAADNDLLEPQAVTALAWVRTAAGPGQHRYIISKGAVGDCFASSYALTTGASGGLEFYVLNGATPTTSPHATAAQVWNGKWHLVAGTFDGSSVRLYVDGKQIGAGTPGTGGIEYGLDDDRLFLGTFTGNSTCTSIHTGFVGDIDEPRVYSRALTPTEVGRLATAIGPNAPPPLGEPGGGAGGSRPVANFKHGKSHTLRQAIWLSGKASKPSLGRRIVKYDWDFNSDGNYDASCGGSAPAVSRPFRKGQHAVRLRVTDSAGKTDVFAQSFSVARADQNVRSTSVVACEKLLGPNQPDRPGCVKTFSFGDIVEVNARGDADQCFKIEPRRELPTVELPGAARTDVGDGAHTLGRYTVYHAKLKGPLALNGIPIKVPDAVQTEYDSWQATIGIGKFPMLISLPGNIIQPKDIPLELKVTPTKGRFALPPLKTGKVSLFGLKTGGGIEVALLKGRRSEIRFSMILPAVFSAGFGKEAEGDFTLHASNTGGVEFEGVRIQHIPHVFLGPLLVNDLFFQYQRTGNIWRGGANFQLAALSPVQLKAAPPPPDYGFGLRNGKFDYAGGGVAFPIPPRPELFPGVSLVEIGGAIGLKPTRFTGRMSIAAGEVFAIDGSAFVALASAEHPYDFPEEYAPPGLEFLGGRTLDSVSVAVGGVAKLLVPVVDKAVPLLNAYLFYAFPDYVEFGGGFKFDMGDDDDTVSIKGDVNGWIQALQKKFNLEGKVEGCIDIDIVGPICKGADAVVSSAGIGLCTVVPVPVSPFGPTIPVDAGIGYRWGEGFPDLMVFSCDVGPYREVKPALRTAATGPRRFTLPAGLPSAMIRVRGVGAAPKLVLTKPGGAKVSIPQTGQGRVDRDVIGITRDKQKTTLIALRRPRGGTWSLAPQPGSKIAAVSVANGLAKPRIKAKVTGSGRKRTLHYQLATAGGRRVTFFERGGRTFHRLGAAKSGRGTIRFRPADGRRGLRTIVALVESGGVTKESLVVAHYTAPASARPGKPRALRVKRSKAKGLVVSWRHVGGAARYVVLAQQSNGFRYLVTTRRTSARFVRFNPFAGGRVLVRALGRNGSEGPTAGAKVKARKPHRR
ncbi:MAG: LamG domain-containing protein [Thermoleophilaceae bacterium]